MIDKTPTRAECRAMNRRLDWYLKNHKPVTERDWIERGADYCAAQAEQVANDFLKLQAAIEGRAT